MDKVFNESDAGIITVLRKIRMNFTDVSQVPDEYYEFSWDKAGNGSNATDLNSALVLNGQNWRDTSVSYFKKVLVNPRAILERVENETENEMLVFRAQTSSEEQGWKTRFDDGESDLNRTSWKFLY